MYGLNQSPSAWFGRFTKAMLGIGYKQSKGDHTLFTKPREKGTVTAVLVYVDDIIVRRNDVVKKKSLENTYFEIKDLGKLKYFLGIEVVYSKRLSMYLKGSLVIDLLKETRDLKSKTISTPLIQTGRKYDPQRKIPKVSGQTNLSIPYKTVYSLAYAVGVVSQFMHNPREEHMQAVLKIFHHLKATPRKGILFRKGHQDVTRSLYKCRLCGIPN